MEDDDVEKLLKKCQWMVALHGRAVQSPTSWLNLGLDLVGEDDGGAEVAFRVAFRLYKKKGDHDGAAAALSALGDLKLEVRDFQAAARHYGQAVAFSRRNRDLWESYARACEKAGYLYRAKEAYLSAARFAWERPERERAEANYRRLVMSEQTLLSCDASLPH